MNGHSVHVGRMKLYTKINILSYLFERNAIYMLGRPLMEVWIVCVCVCVERGGGLGWVWFVSREEAHG